MMRLYSFILFSIDWLLDQHEGNMPQALNDFVDKINTKIALINQ